MLKLVLNNHINYYIEKIRLNSIARENGEYDRNPESENEEFCGYKLKTERFTGFPTEYDDLLAEGFNGFKNK